MKRDQPKWLVGFIGLLYILLPFGKYNTAIAFRITRNAKPLKRRIYYSFAFLIAVLYLPNVNIMENSAIRWNERFEHYSDALNTLASAALSYKDLNELEKDGLIQRFEFTFELAWKTMQNYLFHTGYVGLSGPRNVIKQMGQDGMIDPYIWYEMMEVRNSLNHIYDEESSRKHLDAIVIEFLPVLSTFKNKMQVL